MTDVYVETNLCHDSEGNVTKSLFPYDVDIWINLGIYRYLRELSFIEIINVKPNYFYQNNKNLCNFYIILIMRLLEAALRNVFLRFNFIIGYFLPQKLY